MTKQSSLKYNRPSNEDFMPAAALFRPASKILLDNLWTYLAFMIAPSLYFSTIFAFEIGFKVITTANGAAGSQSIEFQPIFTALMLAGLLYTILSYAPLTYTYVQSAKGKLVGIGEAVRNGLPFLPRLFLLSLLTGLMVIGGLLLFIIPGIIMLRRYYLAPYYLVDRNLSVTDAMKQSADETKLASGAMYGLFGMQILIAMTSILPIFGTYINMVLQLLYAPAGAVRYLEYKRAIARK